MKFIFGILLGFSLLLSALPTFAEQPIAEQPAEPPINEQQAVEKGIVGAGDLLPIFGTAAGFPQGEPRPPEVIAGEIIQGLMAVIGVIFGILVVYGGYLLMIARGNEEQVKKSINILQTAVIGFIVVIAAYSITSYVVGTIIGAAYRAPS